jgi:hypothetical protein
MELFSVIATKSVVNNVPSTPLVMSDGDATVRQRDISAGHRELASLLCRNSPAKKVPGS